MQFIHLSDCQVCGLCTLWDSCHSRSLFGNIFCSEFYIILYHKCDTKIPRWDKRGIKTY